MSRSGFPSEPVLVVSSSRLLFRRVGQALTETRAAVDYVPDAEALERHRRHRPFLVCMVDARGPSGMEVAARCARARPSERYVLILNGRQYPLIGEDAEPVHPFGYLREPFRQEEVVAWVSRAADEAQFLRGDQSLEDLLYGRFRHFLQNLGSQSMKSLHDLVWEHVERPLITAVLEQTAGNQSRAAEILGIHRNTLRAKIRSLNIDPARYSDREG